MSEPYELDAENNTCYIYPRLHIPNGTLLTFDNCPDHFNVSMPKLVKFCCFMIIYEATQRSSYKRIQDFLRDYSSTILLTPAVLFNILSLMVLRNLSRKRSKTSTSNYMMYLCTMDLLTILAKFFHETVVVRNAVRERPIEITDFMCKFTSFFESVCSITSIYLLIAMSIDKLICVLVPLKVQQLLTPTKARIVFIVILIVSSMFSCYELFSMKVVKLTHNLENTTQVGYDCDTKWPERQKDWLLINNIIKVFVPIVILCVCNSWIVIALSKSKKSALHLTGAQTNSPASTKQSKYNFVSTKKKPLTTGAKPQNHIRLENMNKENGQFVSCENLVKSKEDFKNTGNSPKKRKNWTRLNTHQHISLMLFAVSFGFVLLNLPYAIKTLFQRQFSKKNKINAHLYHMENLFKITYTKKEIYNSIFYEFASNMTHFLLDLNYITNFFLYFLSGERFRNELLILLRCKKESTHAKTNQSMANTMARTTTMAACHRNDITSNSSTPAGFSQPRDQNTTTETSFVVSNKKFSLQFK